MDFTTVVIDGEFWATTCVQVRGEPALRNALYEWADWEGDRGNPYSIATGLRLLADYITGPRAPWDIRAQYPEWGQDVPYIWATYRNEMKMVSYPSFLAHGHFLKLTSDHASRGTESKRLRYPTPLAAYLDACYAVDPNGMPLSERRPYQ